MDFEKKNVCDAGDSSSFTIQDVITYDQNSSLRVDTLSNSGGTIKRQTTGDLTDSTRYIFKAYMYDAGCNGTHWLSLSGDDDWEVCASSNGKTMLPRTTVGVGFHSKSSDSNFSTLNPFTSTLAVRSMRLKFPGSSMNFG